MVWPDGLPKPYIYTFPTTFYDEDGKELHQETGLVFLSKGDGVLWEKRYRVVDTWLSFDKHGRFDVGLHVFLEPIEEGGEDDTLGRFAPDYFRDS
jgi:hypothetical protein